ncbi:Uncharacterised protein [Neisseria lactamica]|nr:hypothetical protein [Neisseria lactamica]KFJ37251.1 hypothetical protein DR91_1880 [Neisseria lactamica ATCC 23970]VTQ47740.1 Uncharacterised protein [Neisseria lactamica]
MAGKIYRSQILKKLERLEREKKQVLEHLDLVESRIRILNEALSAMEAEALTDEYSTKLYTYRTYKRRYRCKLRPAVLAELKAEPERWFTVNELVSRVLAKCGQEAEISPQHTASMRNALKHWLNKGVIERDAANVVDVKWRLKQDI